MSGLKSPVRSPMFSALQSALMARGAPLFNVTPVLYADLTSGLAPFGLVFDGAQTTCTDPTVRTFHDLTYLIDFGDGTSATYTSGEFAGLTKNRDQGAPVFAHVYETPGSYVAKMWALDNGTLYGPSSFPVTVTDPDVFFAGAATIAVSDNGDFSWAPAGHTPIAQSDVYLALSNAAVTSNKRVMLRPGGSYTCSASSNKSNLKNFVFASATTTKAVITATANNVTVLSAFSGGGNPANNGNNWRVHDIDFRGGGFTGVRGFNTGILPVATGDANINNYADGNITAHRILGDGLFSTVWINGLNCVTSQVTSTNTTGSSGGMPIYQAGAVRTAVIDCDLDNGHGGEHVMRSQGADFNVILSNRFARPASAKAYLTVRGWGVASNSTPMDSVKHAVRGNTFDGTVQTVATAIYTDIAPQNTSRNEPVKDVVWEGNHYPGCQADRALNVCARDVTVRNNVFRYVQRALSAGSGIAVQIANPNATMTALTDNVRVIGNTAYSSGTDGFSFATIQSAVVNPYVCNNIAYAPLSTKTGENNGTAPTFFGPSSTLPGTLIQGNNSTNANVKSLDPLFVNTATKAGFKLQAGSPYKNFGADYKARADAMGYLKGAAPIDAGALNSVDKQEDAWGLVS